MTRMGTAYRLTFLLPLMTSIKDLTTGRHMIIASNSSWPISYSAEIKCLLGTLTSYSAFGLPLLPSTAVNHHFRRLQICMTLLIPLLLVMLLGNLSAYSITEPSLKVMFRHGCKPNMMFGFGIHALWSTTSCLIPISSPVLIMHRFKSARAMESIAFMTSCLGIGPGSKL